MADVDFIIAGGGLAGACAAFRLDRHGSVLVIDRPNPHRVDLGRSRAC